MKIKVKYNSLRVQVHLSELTYPALYEQLKDAGPYHSAKLLVHLAMAGLELERKGSISLIEKPANAASTTSMNNTPKRKKSKSETPLEKELGLPAIPSYQIPANAADDIGNMFEKM